MVFRTNLDRRGQERSRHGIRYHRSKRERRRRAERVNTVFAFCTFALVLLGLMVARETQRERPTRSGGANSASSPPQNIVDRP